jgi:hypothetical protein
VIGQTVGSPRARRTPRAPPPAKPWRGVGAGTSALTSLADLARAVTAPPGAAAVRAGGGVHRPRKHHSHGRAEAENKSYV